MLKVSLASAAWVACSVTAFAQPIPGAPTARDAVLKAPTAISDAPDKKAVPITISVDWAAVIRPATASNYSVAVFAGADPEVAKAPEYGKAVEYMESGGTLRYHHAGLMGDSKKGGVGWLDYSKKTWDAAKIKAALEGLANVPGDRVITINSWPGWMDLNRDGLLDQDKYEEFAKLCADLVSIINVDQQRHYGFEITNEQDNLYWMKPVFEKKPDHLDELVKIYNQCADAMRKVDPHVVLGGPAATRPDMVEQLRRFVQSTSTNLDFLSVHMYASGDPKDLDRGVYDKAESMGTLVADLVAMLKEVSPNRKIALHVNEFNISWTWETRDPRMVNEKGAIFDALALSSMAKKGLDVACAWNERDNIYGKMGDDFKLRPSAHVFHMLNQNMVGNIVTAKSSRPTRVAAYAVDGEKSKTLMLINQSSDPQMVNLNFSNGEIPSGSKKWEVSKEGFKELTSDIPDGNNGIALAPSSVVWLVFPK